MLTSSYIAILHLYHDITDHGSMHDTIIELTLFPDIFSAWLINISFVKGNVHFWK